ncbi:hypothetical protein OBBRIDRAFT_834551 [Obba rivulosa]|uniref:Uncharacterized protein n=1 Tax=Obba rivulosa TaxID=1052685 RepID=A0A8E2AZD6_9APHY|nr:hypothetical protein OBBRIDRAFT_834551 [Obba rivulosa]
MRIHHPSALRPVTPNSSTIYQKTSYPSRKTPDVAGATRLSLWASPTDSDAQGRGTYSRTCAGCTRLHLVKRGSALDQPADNNALPTPRLARRIGLTARRAPRRRGCASVAPPNSCLRALRCPVAVSVLMRRPVCSARCLRVGQWGKACTGVPEADTHGASPRRAPQKQRGAAHTPPERRRTLDGKRFFVLQTEGVIPSAVASPSQACLCIRPVGRGAGGGMALRNRCSGQRTPSRTQSPTVNRQSP